MKATAGLGTRRWMMDRHRCSVTSLSSTHGLEELGSTRCISIDVWIIITSVVHFISPAAIAFTKSGGPRKLIGGGRHSIDTPACYTAFGLNDGVLCFAYRDTSAWQTA